MATPVPSPTPADGEGGIIPVACRDYKAGDINVKSGAHVIECPLDRKKDCAVICHAVGDIPLVKLTIAIELKKRPEHLGDHRWDDDGPCSEIRDELTICQTK